MKLVRGQLLRRLHRAAGKAALFLCLLLLPAALHAQTPAVELRSITFVGQRIFPDAVLRSAIESSASSCKIVPLCYLGLGRVPAAADTLALQRDVYRLSIFYIEHGYREARITLSTAREGNRLRATFNIQAGEPVRVATIELGNLEQLDSASQVQLRRLRTRLPLRPGDPLSDIEFQAARDTLVNRLRNLGYAKADVFNRYRIPRDSVRTAHIGFDVDPGTRFYFADPKIEGNAKVSSRVISRMLAIEGGALYSREAELRSQRNLFGLEMFRSINIVTDFDTPGDTVTPVVSVEEGPLSRWRTGIGLSTAEYLNAEVRWTARNLLGGARKVEARARVANGLADWIEARTGFQAVTPDKLDYQVTLDLTQPWFFDLKNNLGTGLFVERRSIPTVFVRTSRGAYLGVTRALGPGTSVSAGYRFELSSLDAQDLIFCTSFVACEASEIRLLREPNRLAPVTASLARDRSNSLFSPTRGYIVRVEGEYAAAATGSEFGYARVTGEWTTYREPLRGLVLATRVRPGWARSIQELGAGLGLHPQKRFFAGGANSVRGFSQYQLGPKLLTVRDSRTLLAPDTFPGSNPAVFGGCSPQQINAGSCDVSILADRATDRFTVRPVGGAVAFEANLEARFPLIGERLRGALFADVGQVWTADERVRPSDLIWTPGVGLRYFSLIGPIRIDVGYNTQGAQQLQVLATKLCDPAPDDSCTPDSIRDGEVYDPAKLRNTGVLTTLGRVPWGGNRSPWNRLQLHFSIGQAF